MGYIYAFVFGNFFMFTGVVTALGNHMCANVREEREAVSIPLRCMSKTYCVILYCTLNLVFFSSNQYTNRAALVSSQKAMSIALVLCPLTIAAS